MAGVMVVVGLGGAVGCVARRLAGVGRRSGGGAWATPGYDPAVPGCTAAPPARIPWRGVRTRGSSAPHASPAWAAAARHEAWVHACSCVGWCALLCPRSGRWGAAGQVRSLVCSALLEDLQAFANQAPHLTSCTPTARACTRECAPDPHACL